MDHQFSSGSFPCGILDWCLHPLEMFFNPVISSLVPVVEGEDEEAVETLLPVPSPSPFVSPPHFENFIDFGSTKAKQ